MNHSSIQIDVALDEKKMPDQINWRVEPGDETLRNAKAVMLNFWDGADKTALRTHLWTKDMMVDEMADFFYQTFMMMADTYHNATHDHVLVEDIRQFAKKFYSTFREQQLKENKA